MLDYTAMRAGLAFLPAACALFTGAQLAGRLTHRHGVRLIAAAVGLAVLSTLATAHSGSGGYRLAFGAAALIAAIAASGAALLLPGKAPGTA